MNRIYSLLRRIWCRANRRDRPAPAPEPGLREWADLPIHHPDGGAP